MSVKAHNARSAGSDDDDEDEEDDEDETDGEDEVSPPPFGQRRKGKGRVGSDAEDNPELYGLRRSVSGRVARPEQERDAGVCADDHLHGHGPDGG